ncbi:MAG: M23 family metallopeptidase [Candidatus Omnitrophica bacterium]|nr:M23 family metallopeptidase [Candidatus Omnitrophota bacterium]
MNSRFIFLIFALVTITSLVTLWLHDDISAILFNISEPYFRAPVKPKNNQIKVRADDYGNGEYGSKRSGGRIHEGLDIFAPLGTPVLAAKSGLAFPGNVPTGYGLYVMIYHPDGSQTYYAHLSKIMARAGEKVRRGELIGYTGNTGNAKNNAIQPHLHFEIRKDGKTLDPKKYIR